MEVKFELTDEQEKQLKDLLDSYPDKSMTPAKLAKTLLGNWVSQNKAQQIIAEWNK